MKPNNKNRFTDRFIKALLPNESQTKPIDLREKSGQGFAITLFPSGAKSFIYIYHHGGRKRRMTLGRYPNCSLADARRLHRDALKILESNQDPAALKKNKKLDLERTYTISDLIDEYLKVWAKPRKKSWKEDLRILYKDVKSRWGKYKASDITKRDVILLLEDILKRNAPITANRTLACVRRMFNFAIERDILYSNPCTRIKAPSKENRRERYLNDNEINIFWHNLQDAPMLELTKLALKLQLVTAQRKGEIVSAEWNDVDLASKVWTIPSTKAKNGQSHRVPLSDLAMDLIELIGYESNKSKWLFPALNTKEDKHILGESIDHALLRSKNIFASMERFTPHSLRATAATHMASMRIGSDVISRILNHAKRGVTEQHYNKYDYDDEKRHALEAWSNKLNEIINDHTSTNVVQLSVAN